MASRCVVHHVQSQDNNRVEHIADCRDVNFEEAETDDSCGVDERKDEEGGAVSV